MDKDKRDKLIDDLLVELSDQVDSHGQPIAVVRFSFTENDHEFLDKLSVNFDELSTVLDVCLSRQYLKRQTMGAGKYGNLGLTDEGQGRAISVDAARRNPRSSASVGAEINIGTLNASGATQIGNYNTQNIEALFASLVQQIDNANASEQEKEEAKSLLRSFLEHPLTNTALGAAATAIIATL